MAAEVPAKDVLCEAMEYLSKLGSNLRTRSENLREKKIRRDKLNNVLAVQKAASKVLLICELSKKSLVNVETGVRKILDRIDISQASSSDGGKTTKIVDKPDDNTTYYYFEYKSRKLRVKKRISLKHYTSVRVLAKSMPKSMIAKYPVHYDCKLYRLRQAGKKLMRTKNNSECESFAGFQQEDNIYGKSHCNNVSEINISDSPAPKTVIGDKNIDMSVISIPDTLDKSKPDRKWIDFDIFSGRIEETRPKSIEKSVKDRRPSEKLKEKSDSEKSTRERSKSRDFNPSMKKNKPKVVETLDDSSEKKKLVDLNKKRRNTSETSSKSDSNDNGKKKTKKIKVVDISSGDEKATDEGKEDITVVKEKIVDVCDAKKTTNEEKVAILKGSSEDSSDEEKTNSADKKEVKVDENSKAAKDSDSDESSHQPKLKKRKISVFSSKAQSEESNDEAALESPVDDKNTDMDKEQSENTENEPVKPIIKCVSLSKLLKPDILVKKDIKGAPTTSQNIILIGSKTKPKNNEKDRITESLARKEKEEQEYWVQKRKEVKGFKSKNFVINVTRLPELSIDFLNNLNLRKITQSGLTICEVVQEQLNEKDNKTTSKLKKKDSRSSSGAALGSRQPSIGNSDDNDQDLIAEANKVKNSLLFESDSDGDAIEGDTQVLQLATKTTDIIKNALLNDSDSENKNSDDGSGSVGKNKKDNDPISEAAQAGKAKRSDGSNSNSDTKEPDQGQKIKKTLLNDSDSDSESKPSSDTAHGVELKKRLLFESDSDSYKNKTITESEKSKSNHSDSDSSLKAKQKRTAHEEGTKSNLDGSPSEKDENSDDKSDGNKEENNALPEKKAENLSQAQKNENTPEKISSQPGSRDEKAKCSLLNNSSDDETNTPLSQRKTPQSKKKRMRESVNAKKMLMKHSSSDTEDEQLQNAVKEIKDSLLHGSDEENSSKKKEQNHESGESSPSSDEDILKKVKKKITYDSSSSKEKRVKRKRKKHRKRLQSEDSDKGGSSDNSKSSSSKMVRSKSKPGNSSSQNSDALDASDKDIDGLTNLDSLNKPKSRRRHSNSSDEVEEGSSKTRSPKQRTKPSGLICEEMLKADSSSDASASCEDIQDNEYDLPEVTVESYNGASELLVKDDLLRASESSDSHNESANKDDKDESDEDEKLNARRKKANAISSDSEVGSSRKKDADVKLSDFEDSDDSELTKRTKRKKKGSDSDASAGSASPSEGGKKKRRRIKSVRDSDVSGSESETEGRNKHGRKNIRKVMGKNQLEEATKKAAREEKERVARIAERQKMYNNLEFDESGKPDEVVLDKVVLDFDPETKEPLIEVDRGLVKKLKPHQANGIKFMWNACFESVKRIKKDKGSGCILAHCMGLGKTLQVVSLTHTLLIHSDLTKVNRVLVVCPLSTVLNWVNEFRMWLEHAENDYEVDVYELSRYKQNSERAFQLSQWLTHGGVCVLGYEMFRNLSADNGKKFRKKMLKNFQEALVDPGPDLVVCDEGHLLKNEKTSLSQSMNRVKTLRRIVLTGTPLQNNLKEYYCMVQFVKPNLLGKYNEYLNRFVNPITNGQYTDSTEHDIKIMKRRSHVLHKMLDGAVQRRDYGVLAPFLPPKHEYVLFITLSAVQTKLYQHYLDNFSRRPLAGKSSGFLFPDFQSLQRIWTHPLVLKYNSERYEIMQQKKRDKEEEDDSEGSLVDFINDSSPDETSTEESSDDMSDVSDDSQKKSKKKKSSKKNKGKDKDKDLKGEGHSRPRRGTRANPIESLEDDVNDDVIMEVKNENPTEWWIKLVEDEELDDMRNSHKLVLLFDILRQCETIGDKLLVFSQSLYSLDLIEHFLGKVDEATQDGRVDEKLGGHVGSWSPGIDYFRLDGSTSCENRSIWCKNFNREDNPRARLFLISTRAGGLGINLVAANRVVIFDVSWNPSHDVQSIFRVYRFGQKKPCYVYRFLAMGTMEEKIYERQVTKQAISKRVIDEQQIDRHYAENDLAELYKFEPQPPTPRPLPPLPKDRLFAEMLREHDVQIYKYHEHDSLLENKEEETLSEEERKAAWEDFENEKNRPPPVPFQAPWPMHNGMVPSLLQQQQQQYAFAAVTAMLRKTMPNLNENQIRDMIPLIAAANPQMMQSMNEIYKYAQPGMMNPAMMSPDIMSAVGGGSLGGLGAGGGSSLQYEPPWQRQQHQQQQMRLQQLMQQNAMGAKFYAGGLGSRDPVAMALQQQRAREIMLGNAASAGRPRGRPPLAPRGPPADVVNLDSD